MTWDITDPDLCVLYPAASSTLGTLTNSSQTSPLKYKDFRLQVGPEKYTKASQTDDIHPVGGNTEGLVSKACLDQILSALTENVTRNSKSLDYLSPNWEESESLGMQEIVTFHDSSATTALAWSASGILAVAYGDSGSLGFPEQSKLSLFRGRAKLSDIDVPTFCTSLSFKPQTDILAAGSASGDVIISNYVTNELLISSSSHREAVTQVRWLTRENVPLLASLSAEGKLIFWSFPQFTPISTVPLIGPGRRTLTSRCFDFYLTEFAVGCETGQTARASTFSDISKSPKLKEAESAAGYVSAIAYSPCGRYLAVSGGSELRIFGREVKPCLVLTFSEEIADFSWSTTPAILAVATRSGVHLVDLSRDRKFPTRSIDGSISSVSFSPQGDLGIGEFSGKVRVIRLGRDWGGKYSLDN